MRLHQHALASFSDRVTFLSVTSEADRVYGPRLLCLRKTSRLLQDLLWHRLLSLLLLAGNLLKASLRRFLELDARFVTCLVEELLERGVPLATSTIHVLTVNTLDVRSQAVRVLHHCFALLGLLAGEGRIRARLLVNIFLWAWIGPLRNLAARFDLHVQRRYRIVREMRR